MLLRSLRLGGVVGVGPCAGAATRTLTSITAFDDFFAFSLRTDSEAVIPADLSGEAAKSNIFRITIELRRFCWAFEEISISRHLVTHSV